MDKKQQNWLHVLFIAIAIIGLIVNVSIIFLIGVVLEIWHLWRIFQKKNAGKKAKSTSQASASQTHSHQHFTLCASNSKGHAENRKQP